MKQINEIWTDKFSVGIEEFDRHHKKLLNIIIDLQTSIQSTDKTNDIIKDTLGELVSYTKYHFSAEQELMEKFDFDMMDDHVTQHDTFIQKVEDFELKYNENKKDINSEMLFFLKDWLVRHIMKKDKEYCSFLKSVGFIEKS